MVIVLTRKWKRLLGFLTLMMWHICCLGSHCTPRLRPCNLHHHSYLLRLATTVKVFQIISKDFDLTSHQRRFFNSCSTCPFQRHDVLLWQSPPSSGWGTGCGQGIWGESEGTLKCQLCRQCSRCGPLLSRRWSAKPGIGSQAGPTPKPKRKR